MASSRDGEAARAMKAGRRNVLLVLLIALLAAGVAGFFAYQASLRPSIDDPVREVDLVALAGAAPPIGHVRFTNAVLDPARGIIETRDGKHTAWVPLEAKNTATDNAGRPVAIFYSRWGYGDPNMPTMPALAYDGVLALNALPDEAAAELRKAGVNVDTPHYVLERGGTVIDNMIDDAIGPLAIAAVFLIVALIALIQLIRGRPMGL